MTPELKAELEEPTRALCKAAGYSWDHRPADLKDDLYVQALACVRPLPLLADLAMGLKAAMLYCRACDYADCAVCRANQAVLNRVALITESKDAD